MAKKALLTGLSVLLAFATAGPLWAQSTASLQGTVTDAQGAVVPGASVTASNPATGVLRSALTDNAGYYQMAALPVGTYQVEARLTGFQPRVLKGIALEVARTAVVNVQLSVSTVSEVVAVTAEAPSIDTATTSVGQVINQRTVQDIPLNGRHFVDLGLLIPGSVAPPQNGFLSAPLRGQGSFAFNTAGAREDTVNFMINGVNLNDMAQNQITFQPSINTVQEFKVDNSTFSAQYGRNSGAIVNIATRSGTNDLHGEVFEFLRNQRFDSRNRFATTKSPFNRNQFGANLGGPLVKSRTFFFVTYEGLRQRQGLDLNSGVLTDAERARVTDPVSQKLLALIPEPNAVGSRGEGRFIGNASANVNIDQGTGDLSHQISSGDNLHAYYAFQRDQRVEPNLQGNTIPGFGDTR
ncbi:MAG TPA: carboxypeptidase-like regulatory domain-containing protein, partial [Vicinamibacteria bacterium]|nr:carboxypeptidase-like regulatory domain-containing protein [Vicinamibacteria bacterium]